MTRAQRRTRQRTRDASSAGLRHESREAPAYMLDNPNRGKLGVARLAHPKAPRMGNGSSTA